MPIKNSMINPTIPLELNDNKNVALTNDNIHTHIFWPLLLFSPSNQKIIAMGITNILHWFHFCRTILKSPLIAHEGQLDFQHHISWVLNQAKNYKGPLKIQR